MKLMNRSLTVLLLGALLAPWADAQASADISASMSFRLVELTGDRLPDQVRMGPGGRVEIAVNRGGGVFEPIPQLLPSIEIVSMLHADLNGDGNFDLYLVARGPNVVLLGDGQGGMTEATEATGLVDNGSGLSAEMVEVTGDNNEDLVLHNATSDVLFLGGTARFQRAEPPPTIVYTDPGRETKHESMAGGISTAYPGLGGASPGTPASGTPASGGDLSQADVQRDLEIVYVPGREDGRPTPTLLYQGIAVQAFPGAGHWTQGTVTTAGTLNGLGFTNWYTPAGRAER